jgi:hypothetical protein
MNQHLNQLRTQTTQVSETYPPVTYIRVSHPESRQKPATVGRVP